MATTNQKQVFNTYTAALSRSEIIDMLCAPYATKRSVIIEGPTGIGKSDILKDVAKRTGLRPIYFDCQTKGIEDLTCPVPEVVNGMTVMRSVPHEEFGFQYNEPVIIMCDEIAKNRALIPGIARLLHEHKIGTYTLPEGSIVFGTTNLALENFGDNIPAFIRSRCAVIRMKNTLPEAFEEYMIHADFDPSLIVVLREKSELISCFIDYEKPEENPYIFDPRDPSRAAGGFSCPRSLHNLSDLLKDRDTLSEGIVNAMAAGIVGEAAAAVILQIVKIGDEVPRYAQIVDNPMGVKLPTKPGAHIISALTCMQRVTAEDFSAVFTYVKRLPMEMQGLFANQLMRSPSKGPWVSKQKDFTDFAMKNYSMFSPV